MLVGDSKTLPGSSSSKQSDSFSNERLVGVRQQLPAEDAEPGRQSYSSRLINNKPNKLPMKVTRDDSRGFESDSKLLKGSNNYHSAVHLRQSKDLHNLSSSSKHLESPAKLPAIGTPSNRALKVTWPSVKHTSAGYYQAYKNLIESDITEMNLKDIETENMLLRNALKDMNENLQQKVERVKHSEFIPKRPEFKDKNIDDQMRTLLKELENNEKLLAINEEEYKRLDSKVQQVSDPNYYYDLDKNVKDIYRQIEEQRRDNKKLYITSSATGKNLDRIENITGMPAVIEETIAKEKEIVIVKHKVEDLKAKNEIFKEEKHQKLLKNKKLTEQVKQLSQGKDVDDETERLAVQYKSLQRKLKAAEDDLKLTKNKQKKFMETQKVRELEELFSQHLKDREHFESLDNMIKEQVGVMREMVKNQSGSRNRVIEDIINNLTINLDREEGARERTAQSFEDAKNGVDKTYKSMSPSKGKFSSTQGLGIKGQMYEGLPLFSPETTKSKLIKTQGNKVAVRRELQDQKKPVWRDTDSKNVSKIDMTLIKTIEEKPHIAGYTPSEGLKKLQKALESERDYQKSTRGEKSGSNSPARSIGKMADSIDSSRVEKKEVFRNPKLGNLPNLKANEVPAANHHEQEHNVGLSKKRNNVKPLPIKSKPTEDDFDTEDILDRPDDIKGDHHASTERQKKKQIGTSGILKSQANSRIPSANKNKSPEPLNDDQDPDLEYVPKKKNTQKLETLQHKKPTQEHDEEPSSGGSHKQENSMKKKVLLSQEPSFRNSPADVLEESVRGKRETTTRKSQNLDLKLKKQESRSVSPGKRSDLTIDVDAIEKEHEGVFDFGDEEKKTPVHKEEKSHRQRDEDEKPKKKTVKKEDVLDLDTKPNPRQVAKKNSDEDMFDDAVDNRMKNRNRTNFDQKPKPAPAKKQEDDFEEFEFS